MPTRDLRNVRRRLQRLSDDPLLRRSRPSPPRHLGARVERRHLCLDQLKAVGSGLVSRLQSILPTSPSPRITSLKSQAARYTGSDDRLPSFNRLILPPRLSDEQLAALSNRERRRALSIAVWLSDHRSSCGDRIRSSQSARTTRWSPRRSPFAFRFSQGGRQAPLYVHQRFRQACRIRTSSG